MSQAQKQPKQTPGRKLGRYVSGRPLDGSNNTDGTFLRPATRHRDEFTTPSRWAMRPGWHRAAWRIGPVVAIPSTAWAYWTHPTLVTALAAILTALALTRGYRTTRRNLRTARFRKLYLQPLARAAGPIVGIGGYVRADRWLTVSPELEGLAPRLVKPMSPAEMWLRGQYALRAEPILMWLPEHFRRFRWWTSAQAEPYFRWLDWFRKPIVEFGPRVEMRIPGERVISADDRKLVKEAVAEKLGLPELDTSWSQIGPEVIARFTVRRRPPTKVGLAEIRSAIEACGGNELVAGLTVGNRPVILDLDDDSPHIACSAGSGAGKSVLAKLLAVQVLRKGGRVLILDRKGSHRWARGLAGVTYCTKPADMHAALIGTASLADARNSQAMEEEEGWDPGERVLVIFEEMNATVAMLKAYWDSIKENGDPKTSPAIAAFREIMFMGRSAKVNLFGVAQMLTAATTGGPESRENFGIRCLARYTANAWKMLAPECAMPKKSKTRGRWQIVIAGEATETQVAFLTDDEAREIAHVADVAMSQTPPTLGKRPATGEPATEPVTLREAVENGTLAGSYAAVRQRLQRDPDGPQPVGRKGPAHTYVVADLIEWGSK